MVVGDEDRRALTTGRRYVLLGVARVDALELAGIGNALGGPLDDDRVSAVAVHQNDLWLVLDVAGLVCPRSAREVDGGAVPPEPNRRRVGTSLWRRRRDPDLAKAAQSRVDVAPRDVAARHRGIAATCRIASQARLTSSSVVRSFPTASRIT